MKLNKNSWHARANEYVYGWSYLDNVDCLCPYFWGTLLAIFLTPLWALGHGIVRVIDALPETNVNLPSISQRTKNRIGTTFAYGFFGLMITLLTIAFGLAVIKYGLLNVLIVIGAIALVVSGVIGLFFLIMVIKEKYDDWRWDHPKEKKPNLFMEFVRAKKNKHCPLVEWV